MRRLLITPLAAIALVVAACGSDVNAFPVIASSPGSVGLGEQRILIGVVNPDTGEFLASPDIQAVATLRDRNGSPLGEFPGQFIWTVPQIRGLYVFYMEIPEAGTYQVTLEAGELGSLGPSGLVAMENPTMVSPGDPAPPSVTRTSADHDLSVISSDPNPDPAFYEMSVAEALERGPSVIVFATPAWCTTQSCGPMLDQVKEISADFPDLNFVHVEIYEDIQVQSFEELQLVEAINEWRLPSEPWVFVVDADGVVAAAFEGAAADTEMIAAFQEVSGSRP